MRENRKQWSLKTVILLAVTAVLICAVVAAGIHLALKISKPGDLPAVYPHNYSVEEVTYEAGMYSFTVTAGENTPRYCIAEDMQLSSMLEYSETDWISLGKLEKAELTKDNFYALFSQPGTWAGKENAARIRANTANAWQLIYDQQYPYYVLQQNNGEVYLAYGYCDRQDENDHYSDDSHIRWLFKLAAEHTHQVAAEAQTVDDPVTGYCGNTQTTLYIDGKERSFTGGRSVTLTDILVNLDYDPLRVCRCSTEYTVDTEFKKGYGINLTEGYARCEKGQADLTQEQIDQITQIIEWAQTTNDQS